MPLARIQLPPLEDLPEPLPFLLPDGQMSSNHGRFLAMEKQRFNPHIAIDPFRENRPLGRLSIGHHEQETLPGLSQPGCSSPSSASSSAGGVDGASFSSGPDDTLIRRASESDVPDHQYMSIRSIVGERGGAQDLPHHQMPQPHEYPSPSATPRPHHRWRRVDAREASKKRRLQRTRHIQAEQARRDRLRDSIDALRDLLPDCDCVTAKERVLKSAVEYIRVLQGQLGVDHEMVGAGAGMPVARTVDVCPIGLPPLAATENGP